MLDILDIGVAVPDAHVSVDEACTQLGLSQKDRRMYARFFGLERVPGDPDMPLNALAGAAISRLAPGHKAPELVVHCHTLLAAGPFCDRAAIPVAMFAPTRTEVLSATMCHCASGVAVLELVDCLLDDGATALIVVGDKAFHPAVQLIRNTTLMGDGAAAILVGRRPGRFGLVANHTERRGAYAIITGRLGDVTDTDFADEYIAFTEACIARALAKAGIGIADLALILPHNVNLPSWDQIARSLGARRDQLWLEGVPRYAHTFGADPFLNLVDAEAAGALAPGDQVALVSVGLGATASCAILRVNDPVLIPRSIPAATAA